MTPQLRSGASPASYVMFGILTACIGFGLACGCSQAAHIVPTRGQLEAATDKFCADIAAVRKFEREYKLLPEAGAPGK